MVPRTGTVIALPEYNEYKWQYINYTVTHYLAIDK